MRPTHAHALTHSRLPKKYIYVSYTYFIWYDLTAWWHPVQVDILRRCQKQSMPMTHLEYPICDSLFLTHTEPLLPYSSHTTRCELTADVSEPLGVVQEKALKILSQHIEKFRLWLLLINSTCAKIKEKYTHFILSAIKLKILSITRTNKSVRLQSSSPESKVPFVQFPISVTNV